MADNMFSDLIPKQAAGAGNPFADLIPKADAMGAAKEKLAMGLQAGQHGDLETYRTAAFRTNQGVQAANATDAAIAGATLGFGDEISAATRAPLDMAIRGEGYNEAYQHNLAAERDRLEQYRKANPVTSTAAEIAGGLVIPAGAGAVRTGATIGGLGSFGNSEGDLGDRVTAGGVGAVVGGVLGGAMSAGARALGGKAPSTAPTIEELKAASRAGYNSQEVTGLEVKPQSLSNMAVGLKSKINETGLDEVLAPKTFAILSNIEKIPENTIVTGRNLETIRKTLGKAVGSIDPQEKAAASKALQELNGYLENIAAADVTKGDAGAFSRTIKEANANYSAAKHAEMIDNKAIQAELRAAATNSGQNVANTVRQRMADILVKPKEQRGFTAEELGAMENIVRGTAPQNAMRIAGNVMGGGGGIGAALVGGGSTLAAGPAGLAVPVAGFALKSLSNKITLKQAEKLSEMIRTRAPLASASSKFEEKVAEFSKARNAKTASAAALAARNLATNLKSTGLDISVSDLIGGLQMGGISRAENQKN